MKNIDDWVEWMVRNPELAEKYYPDLKHGLEARIKSSEPFSTALIIQKLPEKFPKWKQEVDQHLGIKRQKLILGYIEIINIILNQYDYTSEIEQHAITSVRDELTEQLEYWEKEICTIQTQKPDLSINQIALKYVYSGIQITRNNASQIIKQYGHSSSEKLFQRYTYYSSSANRKGKPLPFTPRKLKNKINLLESVVEHLPSDKQGRINDEIAILRNFQETEHF